METDTSFSCRNYKLPSSRGAHENLNVPSTAQLARSNHKRRQEDQLRVRIEILTSLTSSMLELADELESLVYPISASSPEGPVDFYSMVSNFERWLIRQALWKTNGSQIRAATLLNMRTTTLNAKIKSYGIQHRKRI